MSRTLPPKERAVWDSVISTEGRDLGLSGCKPFLENKIVNDIFYEGTFNGVPCVVKCSSRAPDSIENEYRMSRRLAAADPAVCAEALARWRSADGSRAFVVTRRLPGPSLTELLMDEPGPDEAIGVLEDMLRIAEALLKSGIVWRDIIPDNFMRDADGHYKLIDAQFAIDRNDFREDPYLLKNWAYRMTVFAHHPMMAGRGWNDAAMMLFYVWKLSDEPRAVELSDKLRSLTKDSAFPVSCDRGDSLRMRFMLVRLRFLRMFAFSKSKAHTLDTRIARVKAFLEHDCRKWHAVLYGRSDGG